MFEQSINQHIDAGCRDANPGPSTPKTTRTSSGRHGPVAPTFNFKNKTGGPTTRHGRSTSKESTTRGRFFESSSSVKQSKATDTIGSRLLAASPLAERLRPSPLDEFVRQAHLTGPGSFLSALTEKGAVGSMGHTWVSALRLHPMPMQCAQD